MLELQWQALFATSSVLSLVVVVLWLLENRLPSYEATRSRVSLGLLLGTTSILGMMMAQEVAPGYRFDLRNAIIATSGLFGGPVSAVIAAGMSAIFRISIGGEGMAPGLVGMSLSAVIGSLAYFLLPSAKSTLPTAIIFSLFVSAGAAASYLTIDESVRRMIFFATAVPTLPLTFAMTVVLTLTLRIDLQRRNARTLNQAYKAMVESLPDCLNAKSIDGHFIAANKATAVLMQAGSAEELVGRTDFDYYPEEIAQAYKADELEIIRTGERTSFQQQVKLFNGDTGWLQTTKIPLRSENGVVIGIITHNRDISNEKRMQKSLRPERTIVSRWQTPG